MFRTNLNTARHAALLAAAFAGASIPVAGCEQDETTAAVRGLHDAIAMPGVGLDREDVNLLMQTDRGRDELAAFANGQPTVFFDGESRFVQVVTSVGLASGRANPSLDLTGPTQTGFTGRVVFKTDSAVEVAGVSFTETQVVAEVTHAGGAETLSVDWAPGGTPPSEFVELGGGEP